MCIRDRSWTVTVAWQVAVLPCPSLTVSVTSTGPISEQLKVFGLTLTRLTVPQLSVPDAYTSAGTMLPAPLPSSVTVAGLHTGTGGVVSWTVTVAWQVAVLPCPSLTVSVTSTGPISEQLKAVSHTHLRAHETPEQL